MLKTCLEIITEKERGMKLFSRIHMFVILFPSHLQQVEYLTAYLDILNKYTYSEFIGNVYSLNIEIRHVGFHETPILNKNRISILCLDENLDKGN